MGEFSDREAIDSLNLQDLFDNTHDPHIELLRLYANDHTYRLHSHGKPHPYNDRGPVWIKDSGPLDCCIVAARLLSVGLTQVDARSEQNTEWISSLDEFNRCCLRAFHGLWGTLTPGESTHGRDTFYRYIVDQYNSSTTTSCRLSLSLTEFNLPSLLWRICVSDLTRQFGYTETARSVCMSCGDEDYHDAEDQGFIELPDMNVEEQPNMAQILQWYFTEPDPSTHDFHEGCTGEGGTARSFVRRRHLIVGETLPVRLAVRPS